MMGTVLAMFFRCFVCNIPAYAAQIPSVFYDAVMTFPNNGGFCNTILNALGAIPNTHQPFSGGIHPLKSFPVFLKIF